MDDILASALRTLAAWTVAWFIVRILIAEFGNHKISRWLMGTASWMLVLVWPLLVPAPHAINWWLILNLGCYSTVSAWLALYIVIKDKERRGPSALVRAALASVEMGGFIIVALATIRG